jgi:DNA-binding response OmpR family regulator
MTDVIPENKTGRGLIIDDEPIVLAYLSRLLNKWNFDVDCASNASDALANIKNREYDFILLDVRMPDISGLVLYKKIEEIKPQLAKRIIFVTGDTAGIDTSTFIRETGTFCVSKPVDSHKLKTVIETVIAAGKNTP